WPGLVWNAPLALGGCVYKARGSCQAGPCPDHEKTPPPFRATGFSWETETGLLVPGLVAGLGVGDDLVGHVLRRGEVVAELHRELAAAGGHRAEVADVSEHFGQRGLGLDAHAGRGVHLVLDHAAAAVEVADGVTDIRLG